MWSCALTTSRAIRWAAPDGRRCARSRSRKSRGEAQFRDEEIMPGVEDLQVEFGVADSRRATASHSTWIPAPSDLRQFPPWPCASGCAFAPTPPNAISRDERRWRYADTEFRTDRRRTAIPTDLVSRTVALRNWPCTTRIAHSRGAALVVSLLLLALLTLFALAAANSARIEHALAQNEQFRENAANAASAGIELATLELLTIAEPRPRSAAATATHARGRHRQRSRSARASPATKPALPQDSAALLAGAHFEIMSTGRSARGAHETQRGGVMIVVPASAEFSESVAAMPGAGAAPCGDAAGGRRCLQAGQSFTTFWQRLPASDVDP